MKIGIVGAGSIVFKFLETQKRISYLEPCAICATHFSEEKKRLLKNYGISKLYCDYYTMLTDTEIEAVYIAVPNHLHYTFSREALLRGFHVVCEKPFCSNLTQLEQLKKLSIHNKCFLFEAISNQYLPNYTKVKECLPQLGNIRVVEMNYSQLSRRYSSFVKGEILPVFDYTKSGGALMDLNVYNIHFVVGLFGKPYEIQYFPNLVNKIDTSGILILKYDEFVCSLIAAKDCNTSSFIRIQGDNGYIHSECRPNSFESFVLINNIGKEKCYSLNSQENRLFYEFEEFCKIISSKNYESFKIHIEHSLMVQNILDIARQKSGIDIIEDSF